MSILYELHVTQWINSDQTFELNKNQLNNDDFVFNNNQTKIMKIVKY